MRAGVGGVGVTFCGGGGIGLGVGLGVSLGVGVEDSGAAGEAACSMAMRFSRI